MVTKTPTNPFNITKAVDFSDQEIRDYWVDIPESGGFVQMAKPTSPMPMLILGGKGSGKTHLMRYFSYPLQRLRHPRDPVHGLATEGYVGVYMRCGGLNSARFAGKRQPDEAWADVFAYYVELWLSQLVLGIMQNAFAGNEELRQADATICKDIVRLLHHLSHAPPPKTVADLRACLATLQQELDTAVNNCALTRRLDVRICTTRGSLTFGVPRILADHLPSLKDCLFVYLIDEFENLSEPQQKYVNTLIREKESPTSFKIGARLYGVRTYGTYSADEDNKEGSEFETLWLDERLRDNRNYNTFAKRLVIRRLQEHRHVPTTSNSTKPLLESLPRWFEQSDTTKLVIENTAFVIDKYASSERPYFVALRSKLEQGFRASLSPGLASEQDIEGIIQRLRVPDKPVLEKLNIFLLYKDWSRGRPLGDSASNIADECSQYLSDTAQAGRYVDNLRHFKADLLAQLYRECDQKQKHLGIGTFIDMSCGLPRNLLVVLKHVFTWAVFNGERPFRDKPISRRSQQLGVAEASEWFYRDARTVGTEGRHAQDSIDRLGTLFRAIRFSDKPSECSCIAFSFDRIQATDRALRIMDVARKWSLLIHVGTQRDRNTDRVDVKYQLNPMLCPRWDLPIYRRGVLALNPGELNAVFDPTLAGGFDDLLATRIARMTAPFFGKRPPRAAAGDAPLFSD